jgi:hypothetical protein
MYKYQQFRTPKTQRTVKKENSAKAELDDNGFNVPTRLKKRQKTGEGYLPSSYDDIRFSVYEKIPKTAKIIKHLKLLCYCDILTGETILDIGIKKLKFPTYFDFERYIDEMWENSKNRARIKK